MLPASGGEALNSGCPPVAVMVGEDARQRLGAEREIEAPCDTDASLQPQIVNRRHIQPEVRPSPPSPDHNLINPVSRR
jgi:hypothetical protein